MYSYRLPSDQLLKREFEKLKNPVTISLYLDPEKDPDSYAAYDFLNAIANFDPKIKLSLITKSSKPELFEKSQIEEVPAIIIEEEIEKLLDWYNGAKEKTHPVELATRFYIRFEKIHPFTDGNGRVGREIFNYITTRNDFSPLNFDITKRDEYIDGLERANKCYFKPIIEYVFENYLHQIRLRLGSNSLLKILDS